MNQLINDTIEKQINILRDNITTWNGILSNVAYKIQTDDARDISKSYWIETDKFIELVCSHRTSGLRRRSINGSHNGELAPEGETYFGSSPLTIPEDLIFAENINPVAIARFVRAQIKKRAIDRNEHQIAFKKQRLEQLQRNIKTIEAKAKELQAFKNAEAMMKTEIAELQQEKEALTQ